MLHRTSYVASELLLLRPSTMLDTVETPLIAAEPERAERVYRTLTLAFAADPPTRWLFPDPADYQRHFATFARALGGAALARGTAYATPDYTGVALWLAPDVGPDEEALAKLIDEGVAPDKQAVMAEVVDGMVRFHPEQPHWYLPFIGVEPARQGKALGAALLRHTLATCDAAQLPAYLESTNPRNRPLYERHGFQAMGEIKVADCPAIVPMLRRPNTSA
jgi:ribosomal protein S18 acetylase RimI-like enzyme